MKEYTTPTMWVENYMVKEQMLFGSEIDEEILDGGAAKGAFGTWEDEDSEEDRNNLMTIIL